MAKWHWKWGWKGWKERDMVSEEKREKKEKKTCLGHMSHDKHERCVWLIDGSDHWLSLNLLKSVLVSTSTAHVSEFLCHDHSVLETNYNWWVLMFCGGRSELTVYLFLQDGLPIATCLTCSWSLYTWWLDAMLYPSIHASSCHAALQHHLDFMILSHEDTWLYMSLANYIDPHIQPIGSLDLWITTWQWCTWYTQKDQCKEEESYTIHTIYYDTNEMLTNIQRIL